MTAVRVAERLAADRTGIELSGLPATHRAEEAYALRVVRGEGPGASGRVASLHT